MPFSPKTVKETLIYALKYTYNDHSTKLVRHDGWVGPQTSLLLSVLRELLDRLQPELRDKDGPYQF